MDDDGGNSEKLTALYRSLGHFTDLTDEERQLIDACRDGVLWAGGNERPQAATPRTKIDARLVRFLALGGDRSAPVHEKGVQLKGAWLDGVLDLGDCVLQRPLVLKNCRIEAIKLDDGRLPALIVEDSWLEQGFNGVRLDCKGVLQLVGNDFRAGAAVSLASANIGELTCSGGRFEGSVPSASTETSPDRMALDLSGAIVRGNVHLGDDFHATGSVLLFGATVGGSLICRGGRFDNAGGMALSCDAIKVSGTGFLDKNVHATGEVRFVGASFGAGLSFSGGRFDNPGGIALACDAIKVAGDVSLDKKFDARGEVRFVGASIGASLNCRDGRFDHGAGTALGCVHIKVVDNVYLDDTFHAKGLVRLFGAKIGGSLYCEGGHCENPGALAFECSNAQIGGDLLLSGRPGQGAEPRSLPGFRASGSVLLVGAQVTGRIVARGLGSIAGQLQLSATRVGVLEDDVDCWTRVEGGLVLDGFSYGRIAGPDVPTDAKARIAWLDRQPLVHLETDFRPQPWEQVIAVLRAMGHPGDARQIAMEKQRRMLAVAKTRLSAKQSGKRSLRNGYHWLADRVGWGFKWLYGKVIGFGYAPIRLLLIMFSVWLVFAAGFLFASSRGSLLPVCAAVVVADAPGAGAVTVANAGVRATPARPVADQAVPCGPDRSVDPFLYSLDAMLPIDLNYQSGFKPARTGWGGLVVRWMVALEITLGYLGTGLLIAALTSLIKKD